MEKLSAGKFHFEPPCSFTSFDHLVGAREQRGRNFDAERFGGLEVDRQLEISRCLHGKSVRACALEDTIDIFGRAGKRFTQVDTIGYQTALARHESEWIYRGHAVPRRKRENQFAVDIREIVRRHDQAATRFASQVAHCRLDLSRLANQNRDCPHTERGGRGFERTLVVLGHIRGGLRIVEKDGVPDLRCDLLEDLQPLRCHCWDEVGESGGILPGACQALDEAASTGSDMAVKTIGTVPLSCCRAATATELKAKIASGLTASSSPAKRRFRSGSPAVQRSSICKLSPALQPSSSSRLRNVAIQPFVSASSATPINTPIRRTPSRCCARAVSGHAAAPPSSVMNARRFIFAVIRSPRRRGRGRSAPRRGRVRVRAGGAGSRATRLHVTAVSRPPCSNWPPAARRRAATAQRSCRSD